MIAALLFDCDGVLVDSEPLIARVLVAMSNELGGRLTLDDGLRMFRGAPLELCAERIARHLGRSSVPGLEVEYRSRVNAVFATELAAVDGVEQVLRWLPVPAAVVSNSARTRVLDNLRLTGLLRYFGDRVYSAHELSCYKPAPQVYLHAAEQLHFTPGACVAVEDSPAGVRSAVLAGMPVVGFGPGPAGELRQSGATWTCSTMRELKDFLPELLNHETREQLL